MKNPMTKIIEELMNRKCSDLVGVINLQIQLSAIMMDKFIQELRENSGSVIESISGMEFSEVYYRFRDREWKIYNRAYRDDTNDSEIEQLIYEFLSKSDE